MSVIFAPRIAERWEPAAGLVRRGTVVVLPGRGDHGEAYERLGRRLANDAYLVVALDVLPSASVAELVPLVRTLESADRPLVLLGSDTGGLEALQIAVLASDLVSAVVVAALPGDVALGGGVFTGPVLVLHGDDDPVTRLDHARSLSDRLPNSTFVSVRGGRHDVLSDLTHGTVAAELLQFLERVRSAPSAGAGYAGAV